MRITNTVPVSVKKAAQYNARIGSKSETKKTYIKVPGTNKLKQVSIPNVIA